MAIIKLQCPDCAETFKWPSQDKWPNYCPNCKADVSQDPEKEIAVPFISLKSRKAPDDLFRQMERGAEHRVNVAAEMTGLPASEFADTKITNMKDNLREGDTADMGIAPNNEVAKAMESQTGAMTAVMAREAGIAHSHGVSTGPHANAGARMQSVIRSQHSKYVPQGVSDMPALETQNPIYRRRVR